ATLRTGPRPPARAIWMTVLSLVVLGLAVPAGLRGGRLSQEDTETIVAGLLLNVYKAFDYREEEVIYDALARSAAGDLLTAIYLDTRRTLELANQGGARAKVKSVDVLDATHDPLGGDQGFRTRATWNVAGSVGHWGHIHQRVNQYEAELTVRVIDGAWRITDLEVLQEERLPSPSYPGSGTAVPPAGGM
ncbi:MAG: hypothetical protein KJO44_09430, partial [Gemmatimonadetes bacterium]|nr:hypothetical protein [Gemmatimonadota bacterium]